VISTTIVIGAVTIAIAFIITLLMRRWAAKLGFVDVPNARSSHLRPTARGGGIAIVTAYFVAILLMAYCDLIDSRTVKAFIIGCGSVALIGFIDDRRPLPALVRLAVQVAAAFLVIALIGFPEAAFSAWGLCEKLIGVCLSAIALLWGTNLYNFMDGIDGIAGSEAVFIASSGALLNYLMGGNPGTTGSLLCLAAACTGFLIFNWPPASIFMGDVGSGFLGFSLVALAIRSSESTDMPLEVWLILGGVFLVDATVTLLMRIVRGDKWREAHRTHAYQHLALRLRGHRPVTLIVIAVDVFWLLPFAWFVATHEEHRGILAIAALLPLVAIALVLGAGVKQTTPG
jgi:Fuc2NAc and GlcNAc transferase